MDVAGLSKLSRQAILNIIMALGFLAHGYATGEFEVTEERLGVYLPVEHIDNPKGLWSTCQTRGDKLTLLLQITTKTRMPDKCILASEDRSTPQSLTLTTVV